MGETTVGVGRPQLTVIVPTRNQCRYLSTAVNSILSAETASYELLVLDGGSTDGTVQYLESLGHRPGFWWRSRRDGGVAQAINEGLERAQGTLCVIQSSDDEFLPGAVGAAERALQMRPDAAVAYADAEYIDAEGRILGRTRVGPYSYENLLAKRTFIMQGSAYFRTKAARAVGGLRPTLAYVCDSDLWLRLGRRWPMVRVEGLWSRYRIHPEQRDTQATKIIQEWWACIRDLKPQLSQSEWCWAQVGAHMTEHRYGSRFGLHRALALWRAVALRPDILRWPEFPLGELALPVKWAGSSVLRAWRHLRGAAHRA